jgi:tetratricopeptide (TPR) repeat protein
MDNENIDKTEDQDSKPFEEESQPVSEEGQPVSEENQAVADESQPTNEEGQPVAEEGQHTAEEEQPVSEEVQPTAQEGQAVAEEGQPVSEEGQPVAEEAQPTVEEGQAVAEEGQPVSEEGQPTTEEEQAATEESQPVSEEAQPTAEEVQAVAEEGQPVAAEAQPTAEEGQPVAEESQPVAEESQLAAAVTAIVNSLRAAKELIKSKIGSLIKYIQPSVDELLSRAISNPRSLVILNIIAISAIAVYIILKPDPRSTTAQTINQTTAKQIQTEVPSSNLHTLRYDRLQDRGANIAFEHGISWRRAEQLYDARRYIEAYEVFRQLAKNLNTNRPGDEYVRDFMHLKMVVCLQQAGEQSASNEHLTVALQSGSPAVRALANYHLIFTENHKKDYLSARMRAYRTLSLLKTVKDAVPESFEADCYFMIAECLTKHVLLLSNEDEPLPGKFWLDTLTTESVQEMEQEQLWSLLERGIAELNDAVLVPQVKRQSHLSVGLRWSAICNEAPLEELLTRFASSAELNLQWQTNTDQERLKPTTLFLPTTSEQMIAEVSAGSTGLIAQLDAESIRIYNPKIYDNLDEYNALLVREAILVWRRFLLQHRGDYRTPNAHFALGLLQEHAGEHLAALGEYKLLSSHYAQNPLAPFALLNSSKLKTNMLDYTGASKDLTELIIQYPDCKVADKASLYLAEATMQAGLYDQAIKMFLKVYNLDLNPDSQKQATFGLGKCFFETQNYEDAKKWLSEAIKLIDNPVDERLCPAYFMLGKTEIELGNYEQASTALRKALQGLESKEEYIRITLCLVNTEMSQQNFVGALNILENVPVSQLSQEYACEVLIAKAYIFREIGITDTAISLLRRKIEFIADSELRARLSFELSKCYRQTGDFRIARKEVTDAIADLPSGAIAQQAKLLLADVSIELGEYEHARQVCLQFLNAGGYDEENRNEALELLGRAYTKLDKLDKAALAYTGIYDQIKVDAK